MHDLIHKMISETLVRLRGDRIQRAIAKRAGVPTGTLCQWEKGTRLPRANQYGKLARGLECTVTELENAFLKTATLHFENRSLKISPEDYPDQTRPLLRILNRLLTEQKGLVKLGLTTLMELIAEEFPELAEAMEKKGKSSDEDGDP